MNVCAGAERRRELTLTWLHQVSSSSSFRTFPKVYKGTHVTHPSVTQLNGTTITPWKRLIRSLITPTGSGSARSRPRSPSSRVPSR